MANEKENEQTVTEKKELQGAVKQAQIDQWKALYGEVYSVTGDGKICYLKKPDRKIISYVSTLTSNPIKASETMLNSCWLGGCEDFKTDDGLFFGLSQKIGALVQIKEAELAKL